MSHSNDRATATNGRSPSPPPRFRYPRPIFWLLLFGVIGPCAVPQVPKEIGRWKVASAVRLRENGQPEAAYQKLEQASGWFSNSPELLLQRAEWKLADGETEAALADADKLLTSAKENQLWLMIHASFVQHAGHFAKAIDDWKKVDEYSFRSGIPPRATALNGLAYSQALAKTNLEDALKNVNEALEHAPGSAGILDTRGYIHYLKNDHEAALADLDQAVRGLKAELAAAEVIAKRQSMPAAFRRISNLQPKRLAEFLPAPDAVTLKERTAYSAAVLYYHRSLILAALDRTAEADKDRETARQLIGRDPDDTLF
jgi:tetratricopeptide (TPR) repeat protein